MNEAVTSCGEAYNNVYQIKMVFPLIETQSAVTSMHYTLQLYFIVHHFIVLYCNKLNCTTLYYRVLHCTVMHFTSEAMPCSVILSYALHLLGCRTYYKTGTF